jgi:hypothetical protein
MIDQTWVGMQASWLLSRLKPLKVSLLFLRIQEEGDASEIYIRQSFDSTSTMDESWRIANQNFLIDFAFVENIHAEY